MRSKYDKYDQVNFRTWWETADYILIRDLGPWDQFLSITNGAEWVVQQLAPRLGNRKLYYIDSDGETSQLLVHDGRFAGFAPGSPEQPQVREPADERVYFAVTVPKHRADFLARMLDAPLCRFCGREVAECEADPCAAADHHHQADAQAGRVSHWDADPDYPVKDWQLEVWNDDTRQSYQEWVKSQRELEEGSDRSGQ